MRRSRPVVASGVRPGIWSRWWRRRAPPVFAVTPRPGGLPGEDAQALVWRGSLTLVADDGGLAPLRVAGDAATVGVVGLDHA